VIVYGLLARALGTSQPFYGLEHPGLDDGEVPPDRVESVAAGFLEDMQRQAPNQPCILMGACSGAIVAFELARLLEEAGRCVELVIMLDPSRIGRRRSAAMTGPLWRRLAVLRFVAGRLASYVREFSRLEGAGRWDFVKEKRARLATLLRQPDTLRDSVRHLKRDRIREATVAALYRYVPRPYGGPVALIPGERFDSSGHGKSGSDWHSLCSGPLEVLRMPGMTSGEMLRPPLLEHLVRHLRDLLDHNVPARFDVERRLQPPRTRARKRALYGETRIALVAASDKGRDDGFGYSCRVTVIGRFLFLGPILVLFAWFAAGQWDLAGPETRAWLQFTGIVCVASLIPLPGASWSPSVLAARVRWWGWVVVAGLLVAS
jgi:thioesterase domain-containing protein